MLIELVVVANWEEKYSKHTVWDDMKELVNEKVNRPRLTLGFTPWWHQCSWSWTKLCRVDQPASQICLFGVNVLWPCAWPHPQRLRNSILPRNHLREADLETQLEEACEKTTWWVNSTDVSAWPAHSLPGSKPHGRAGDEKVSREFRIQRS